MRWTRLLLLIVLAGGVASPGWAGNIYKCQRPSGETVYQDTACANASHTQRTFHFHDSAAAGAISDGQKTRTAKYFIHRHPDVLYGNNVQLMQAAMRALNDGKMSYWALLSAGYAKASTSSRWMRTADRTVTSAVPRVGARQSADPQTDKPATSHGLGVSAYASGRIHAFRCTKPNGHVYYARGACGHSSVRVTGGGPAQYTATDPRTGRVVASGLPGRESVFDPVAGHMRQPYQLTWTKTTQDSASAYRSVPDQATPVTVDAACAGEQKIEAQHPFSHKITRRVEALCQQGRSLYDLKPSRGSLYYRDGGKR